MSIGGGSRGSNMGQVSPFPMTPSGGQNTGLRSGLSINKPIKTQPNRKPLYVEMAERNQEVEKQSLEEKKKKLEEIRSFHQPLKKESMMDHALKYDQIRMEK